ncbi:MAG TPA: tRNA-dihydrouridine synthase [Puia sp.]|nr:tRNA-dihydrouridine synthase [Puia sp.]
MECIRQHLRRSVEWKGKVLGILEMRRHYSNYLRGFPHIRDFRNQLVQKNSLEEIDSVLEEVVKRYAEEEVLVDG